jgi:hypothetical protein
MRTRMKHSVHVIREFMQTRLGGPAEDVVR